MHPQYSLPERVADGVVHVTGVIASITGIAVLMAYAVARLDALGIVSLVAYALGLAAMIGFSAAYHMTPQPTWKERLRRLDHSAIFVMIAGSYTPFALVKIGGAWGYTLFGIVWGAAALGVTLKLCFPRRLERVSIALYLAQGWTVVAAIGPLSDAVALHVMVLLGVGGVLYTAGVAFHLWQRLPYHNAIWHLFVLAAAVCHYAAVLDSVALV